MGLMRILIMALLAASFVACSPCDDYCVQQCECDDDTSEGCVETCLDTLNVYSPDLRDDECTERLDALEEDCR